MDTRNVIFMMLDTVRADMLRPYGGDVHVENIEAMSRRGTRYDMAIAPGTYTLPSHLSLFVGKRPRSIPWLRNMGMKYSDMMTDPYLKKSRFASNDLTIARVMEYFGYRSALFSNNPFVSEATGLASGFSFVSNIFIDEKLKSNKLHVNAILHLIQNDLSRKGLIKLAYAISSVIPDTKLDNMYLGMRKRLNRHFSREYGYYDLDKGASKSNNMLEEYLKRNRDNRNFIFMNYMEGHEGYPTNLVTRDYVEQDKWLHMIGEASKEDLNATKEAYKKRIEYLDGKVGQAMKIMKRNGILDDATVIISSDHGQAFMEHGHMFHNVYPYNEVARVPLVIADFKSGKQVRVREVVDEPFSLIDLNRMIAGKNMDVKRQAVINDHIGITEVWDAYLLKLFRKRSENADKVYRKKVEQDRQVTAIFYKNYKLMHHYGSRKDELYDLSNDMEEKNNIIDSKRGIAHQILAFNSSF